MSKAYGPEGVLVNAVGSAFIATPMTDEQMEKKSKEKGISFDQAVQRTLDEDRPGIVAKHRRKAEEVAGRAGAGTVGGRVSRSPAAPNT